MYFILTNTYNVFLLIRISTSLYKRHSVPRTHIQSHRRFSRATRWTKSCLLPSEPRCIQGERRDQAHVQGGPLQGFQAFLWHSTNSRQAFDYPIFLLWCEHRSGGKTIGGGAWRSWICKRCERSMSTSNILDYLIFIKIRLFIFEIMNHYPISLWNQKRQNGPLANRDPWTHLRKAFANWYLA